MILYPEDGSVIMGNMKTVSLELTKEVKGYMKKEKLTQSGPALSLEMNS